MHTIKPQQKKYTVMLISISALLLPFISKASCFIGDFEEGWRPSYYYVDAFYGSVHPDLDPIFFKDITGDGKDDMVAFGSNGVEVAISVVDESSSMFSFSEKIENFGRNKGGWRETKHIRTLADVNGDGRYDIVGIGNRGVYVALAGKHDSDDSKFGKIKQTLDNFGTAQNWNHDLHPRYLVDVNGDGRDDIVGFGGNGVIVATANKDGYFTYHDQVHSNFGYYDKNWGGRTDTPRFLADLNGDNKPDLIGFNPTGVYYAMNTTKESGGQPTFDKMSKSNSDFLLNYKRIVTNNQIDGLNQTRYPIHVIDLNNDQNADILGFGEDYFFVAIGDGTGNFDPKYGHRTKYSVIDNQYTQRHVVDVNGDNYPDIVGFSPDGYWIGLNKFSDYLNVYFDLYKGNTDTDYFDNLNLYKLLGKFRYLADVNGDSNIDFVGFFWRGFMGVNTNSPFACLE